MIRSTLELLTRPIRRRRWNHYRRWVIGRAARMQVNPLDDGGETFYREPEVPCTWEERDHEAVKQDVHRWAEGLGAFLRRLKSDLKKVNVVEASRKANLDPDYVNPLANDEDMKPRWGEPKEIRDAKRRAALKQALRRKVPKGLEGLV